MQPKPQQINIGGMTSMQTLGSMQAEEATAAALARAAEAGQAEVVLNLVSLIKEHWSLAKTAKQDIENQMLDAVRAKAGRYSAAKEAQLAAQGGSQIYMMLFASKARQAKALLADVMVGSGAEKPWTLSPSPKPEIPPQELSQIVQSIQQVVTEAEQAMQPMSVAEIRSLMRDAKERLEEQVLKKARQEARDAETYLDDVLTEGGFQDATADFLDDLTVFKTAFMKRVIRMEPQLTWQAQPGAPKKPVVTYIAKKKWERADPFMMYPASWAKSVQDGYLIERHRLSRGDLDAMRGVDGYSEDAIRAVLEEHGRGGLHEWLQIDTAKANAENRNTAVSTYNNTLIDALQYWGSVSGKMLREWGMKEITDDAKEYPVECWLIGRWVIKAVINPDPLARRPYYADGYSRIPGAFWHNSLYDLISDCVDMCNASARALANNLGIASGPQVGINIDRLAPGEEVTEMYPWKIWQFGSDPMGNSAAPITFFQPESYAPELLSVYEKFVLLADEYSGIPRYMTGTEGTPGAGRTASGLSMMVGNASKVIKSLVASLDQNVVTLALTDLFNLLMQTDAKFDYSGDLQIVARGALSLTVKETANQARMQFLQVTGNPIDMQIVGVDGRAAVLREVAKGLDMPGEDVVPSLSAMRMRQVQQAMAQQAQGPQGPPGQPPAGPQSGQVLANGGAMTDTFSPTPQPA